MSRHNLIIKRIMAKKATFDNLPAMVEKILGTLTTEGSEHTAAPEILQRVKLLEKRFDSLERLISPDRPVMDKQTVLRVLKLRAKQLAELENDGVLISHKDGRSVVFYEDDVMRFFAKHGWKAVVQAASQPESATPAPAKRKSAAPEPVESVESEIKQPEITTLEATGRIDTKAACRITGRNPGAIYQLIKTKSIPSYKDGNSVFFIAEELMEWVKTHPARKYKRRHDKNELA